MPMKRERPHHYILKGHEVVPVDFIQWAQWFEEADDKRFIAEDFVGEITAPVVRISTVFVGLDLNPFGSVLLNIARPDFESLPASVWYYYGSGFFCICLSILVAVGCFFFFP